MQIGFKWLDTTSKNYVDLFDENIFLDGAFELPIEHIVLKPNGRLYGHARCLMTVQNTSVTLDYTAYPKHNNDNGMLLGITKFTYNKTALPPIYNVSWSNDGNVFDECEIDFIQRPSKLHTQAEEITTFDEFVLDASSLTEQELQNRLPARGFQPPKRVVTTIAYLRNPYVVAFTLRRAKGVCEKCKEPAPFISKATNQPYLEVHHKTPLSNGGTDDISNTWAVCPNCHRKLHLGAGITSQSTEPAQ